MHIVYQQRDMKVAWLGRTLGDEKRMVGVYSKPSRRLKKWRGEGFNACIVMQRLNSHTLFPIDSNLSIYYRVVSGVG